MADRTKVLAAIALLRQHKESLAAAALADETPLAAAIDTVLSCVQVPASEHRFVDYDPAKAYTDSELVYAARSRCKCGAGLAYLKGSGGFGFWACSTQLTHRAKEGEREVLFGTQPLQSDVRELPHSLGLSFAFWEIKSEVQPSALGATTRPKPGVSAAADPCASPT